MKRTWKSLASLVLVFAMLVSLLPVIPAYAEEEPQEAVTVGESVGGPEAEPAGGEAPAADTDEPKAEPEPVSAEDPAADADGPALPLELPPAAFEAAEPDEAADASPAEPFIMDLIREAVDTAGDSGPDAAVMAETEVPAGYIEVYTKDDLYDVRNDPSGEYIQMADIEFTAADFTADGDFYNMGQGWSPIGTSDTPFTGTYDGNGYTISGLQITSTEDNQGLFGCASGATLQNITLENARISGGNNVGGICGYVHGVEKEDTNHDAMIYGCRVSGRVQGKDSVGGIIGAFINDNVSIQSYHSIPDTILHMSQCCNTADISGENSVGGLCGIASGTNVYDKRYWSPSYHYEEIIIFDCYSTGNVRGTAFCGGIVGASFYDVRSYGLSVSGYSRDPTIENVYSIGTVAAEKDYGGITGSSAYTGSCYYLESSVSNPTTNTYGTATSADQLRRQGLYEQWDFDSVWTMNGDPSYRYAELRCFVLDGTVSVTGDAVYGATVKADLSDLVRLGSDYTVTWEIGGKQVSEGMEYLIAASDVGKILTATVTSHDDEYPGYVTSEPITVGKAANTETPKPSSLVERTVSSLTVSTEDGQEYSLDRTNWQTSGVFTGLEPAMSYTVYTRFAENDRYAAGSEIVVALTAETEKTPLAGAVSVEGTAEFSRTLTANAELLSPADAEYIIEWRTGETVLGTGDSYTPAAADVGKEITAVAVGTGDYTGEIASAAMEVARCDLSAVAEVTLPEEQTYTRAAITPAPTVQNGSVTLRAGTDYTVAYSDNTDVGEATVTLTGAGSYRGTVTRTFTILPKSLESLNMASIPSVSYTGSPIEPELTILDGSDQLAKGTEYTVSCRDNLNLGTATVTVTGTGNYSGSLTRTFQIVARPVEGGTVTLDKTSFVYIGQAITPAPTVSVNGRTLTPDTDYSVSYESNTDVGTATVTVTGTGAYTGTLIQTFEITQRTLKGGTVTLEQTEYPYTGEAVIPALTVVVNELTLIPETDYTVSCENNVTVGKASLTVTGTGNYTGTLSKTFKVVKQPVTDAVVTMDKTEYVYTGQEILPVLTVTVNGRALTMDTDYTASFKNNLNVGTATVTVKGTDNYSGSASVTFPITPRPLDAAEVALEQSSIPYTGELITPAVAVTLGDTVLTRDKDYTVSFEDNIDVGTATVTVTGTGNYSGSLTRTFTIVKQPITEAAVTTDKVEYDYTEQPVIPAVTVTLNGKTLTADKDYTAAYENNIKEGTATVTVTGAGGYTGTAQATFQITGHIYGDWVTTQEATCTKDGEKIQTCSGCGDVISEVLPALGHVYSSEVVAPTLEAKGYTLHTCSRCGDTYKDEYVSALPYLAELNCCTVHVELGKYRYGLLIAASYNKSGRMLDSVRKNTYAKTKEYDLTFRDLSKASQVKLFYVEKETFQPLSGVTIFPHTVGTSHVFRSEVLIEATCQVKGKVQYTCETCGYSYTETTDKTGHTPVTDPAVAATCTTTGLTEGSHCAVCGTVIAKQKTVARTAHTPVTDPAVAATCTTTGLTEGSHCAVCGAVIKQQKTVAKTAHTPVTDPAVAATCTTTGLTAGSHCAVCGVVIKQQNTVPVKSHTWQAADCTHPKTCTVCGTTEGSALGHNYVNGKCSRCGQADPGVVTGISLNRSSLSLTTGQTATLSVSFTPSTAWASVTWTSSNTSVATVSSGTVKAIKAGTATITASAGGKTASCSVTVTFNAGAVAFQMLVDYAKSNANNIRNGVYYSIFTYQGSSDRSIALIYDPSDDTITFGFKVMNSYTGMVTINRNLQKPYYGTFEDEYPSTGNTYKGLAYVYPSQVTLGGSISFSGGNIPSYLDSGDRKLFCSSLYTAGTVLNSKVFGSSSYSLYDLGFTSLGS